MHSYIAPLAFATLLASSSNALAQRSPASLYTTLSGSACVEHVDDESTGASTSDCPGIEGFQLQILKDDERSSINVVTPDKRVLPLDYWEVATHGFSTLGIKVEWRVMKKAKKIIPYAVIVRINVLDQSDLERLKRVPILAVARISHSAACVTRTVDANAPNATEQARRFADDDRLPCLPGRSDSKAAFLNIGSSWPRASVES